MISLPALLAIPALEKASFESTAKLLSVLSKKNNLMLFMSAKNGLLADSSSPHNAGLSKKIYYTSLKRLINSGLIIKTGGKYLHTSLGSVIYESHILKLTEQMRNTKHLRMIDTLKYSGGFSDTDIEKFISNLTGVRTSTPDIPARIEMVWTYEEMVSAIVERTEFCRNEILLASRYFNEIIINSILRKAKLGVDVKVISEKSLVTQFFEQNNHMMLNDKNSLERSNVVGNPWYPGKIDRQVGNVPFSIIIFDRKEVGIEFIDANEPKIFKSAIFIRDEQTSKIMMEYFQKMWTTNPKDTTISTTTESSVSSRYMQRTEV
jgi:predicted transcriptional regulator